MATSYTDRIRTFCEANDIVVPLGLRSRYVRWESVISALLLVLFWLSAPWALSYGREPEGLGYPSWYFEFEFSLPFFLLGLSFAVVGYSHAKEERGWLRAELFVLLFWCLSPQSWRMIQCTRQLMEWSW
jgi:hypothetical protein